MRYRGRRHGRLLSGIVVAFWVLSAGGSAPAPARSAAQASLAPDGAPAAANPDRDAGALSAPPAWGRPAAIHVWPDSITFGEAIVVAVDFPVADGRLEADSLVSLAAWLVAAPDAGRQGLAAWWQRLAGILRQGEQAMPRAPAGALPAPAGRRVARVFHVQRPEPFRLVWGEEGRPESAMVRVGSLLAGNDRPAAVRQPQALGWRRERLLLLAALAALVAIGWRRRRRRPRWEAAEAPLPPPAYLAAAVALRELAEGGLAERGEGRRFLDLLAGRLRGFLAAHYGIPAAELTAPEIEARLLAGAHRPDAARSFARLLAEFDRRRYAPGEALAADCQALLGRAVEAIDRVSTPARFTPVPAALAVAGEAAWSWLRAQTAASGATARRAGEGGDV